MAQCDLCNNEATRRYRNLDLCEDCIAESGESEYQADKQSYFLRER